VAGLSAKEIKEIVKHIEPQGVVVEKTKDGLRLKLPNGETAGVHWTGSDSRGGMALRASLKRAGVSWPWDHQKSKEKMMADAENEYLSGRKPQKRTLDKVQQAVDAIHARGEVEIAPPEVKKLTGIGDYGTLYRGLAALGYVILGKKGKTRVWHKPGLALPEVAAPLVAAVDPDYPEISKAAKAALEQPAPTAPVGPRQREFIDTHDSWTIELKSTAMNEMTVRNLRHVLLAAGLQLEIRVWLADPADRDAFFAGKPATPKNGEPTNGK
jgi:hypothetical protein